jgi:predicted ATPase
VPFLDGLDVVDTWLSGSGAGEDHEALALAHELAHHFSLASAQAWAATFHMLCGDAHATQEQSEAAMALSTERGFLFRLAQGVVLRGWALVMQGQAEDGIAQLRQGMAAWRATGAEISWAFTLIKLAEAYGKAGQAGEGLTALAEALAVVNRTGERYFEAELHRLKGGLLLQQDAGSGDEAETCFHQALEMARCQQAKSLELRAAMSLSRLWQRQGKWDAARELLAPIYAWFTEGFDTADLQEAKALLNELA